MTVKLIAHALIQKENKYLLIQRTAIKRGQKNIYPHFWDIPGGSVEAGETPQEAARRDTLEEVGLEITLGQIIHEDSQYDVGKATVFTRLVDEARISENEPVEVVLDPQEHQSYRWISELDALKDEKIVPYLMSLVPWYAKT